jgi:hypothetical protein
MAARGSNETGRKNLFPGFYLAVFLLPLLAVPLTSSW